MYSAAFLLSHGGLKNLVGIPPRAHPPFFSPYLVSAPVLLLSLGFASMLEKLLAHFSGIPVAVMISGYIFTGSLQNVDSRGGEGLAILANTQI